MEKETGKLNQKDPGAKVSYFKYGPVRICRPTDLALQGPDTYSVITTS